MYRTALISFLLLSSSFLKAEADIELFKDLVGTYPIVEYLGSPVAAGKAEIFFNETELGIKIIPLKLSSHPVSPLTISSPRNESVLKRDAKGVYQTFEKGAEQARIDYLFADGYLAIDASQCGSDHCVKETNIHLSRGGAPGTKIDTLTFLKKVRGNYRVEMVGGEPPHSEDTSTAEWTESEEPGVEFLRFPYCQPTGCDPGFIDLKQAELSVYQAGTVYTLMVNSGKKLLHFSWEEKSDGKLVFTNYQFKLLTKEIVALEYVLTPAPQPAVASLLE